jgi:hypothetical protein
MDIQKEWLPFYFFPALLSARKFWYIVYNIFKGKAFLQNVLLAKMPFICEVKKDIVL